VITGDYRSAAAAFVDFWSGKGTWSAIRPAVQLALTRWAPKAPLDFAALLTERTKAIAYAKLRFPVLIIRGEHAPAPTRLIAEALPSLLPNAHRIVVAGAGHMGPLTHTTAVNVIIAQHLAEVCGRHSKPDAPPGPEHHRQFLGAGAAP
jgi:pimeloyl-ACP methyl ester carboxylesterase